MILAGEPCNGVVVEYPDVTGQRQALTVELLDETLEAHGCKRYMVLRLTMSATEASARAIANVWIAEQEAI